MVHNRFGGSFFGALHQFQGEILIFGGWLVAPRKIGLGMRPAEGNVHLDRVHASLIACRCEGLQ
jgi:hypothetical protein